MYPWHHRRVSNLLKSNFHGTSYISYKIERRKFGKQDVKVSKTKMSKVAKVSEVCENQLKTNGASSKSHVTK